MLKKISELFLGLVVCAGSTCVTPTHASSAAPGIVIVHIQAASPQNAKHEMVSIYNNGPYDVDITNWCLKNKSAVEFSCFTAEQNTAYYLPTQSFAVVVSEQLADQRAAYDETYTKVFPVTNQSSGSIVNGADTITLVDAQKRVVDSYTWASSIPSGKVATRSAHPTLPGMYDTFDPLLSWSNAALGQFPVDETELLYVVPSDPPFEDEPEVPIATPDHTHPHLTEIFPNPAGSDEGKEFIELYNPTDQPIELTRYRLRVGKTLEKEYSFPAGAIVQPFAYRAFYNSKIPFTLLNTTSSVQLVYDGQPIGDVVSYADPKDDTSWAFIDGAWSYTTNVTPAAENSGHQDEETVQAVNETSSLKPCAAHQYRSPETNRCRTTAVATTSQLQPCKAGQYRSLETNRCRNQEAASTATACREGQERNPETNRCRAIVQMTKATHGIATKATESAVGMHWYWWVLMGGGGALVLGYVVWEWRYELRKLFNKTAAKFARTKP